MYNFFLKTTALLFQNETIIFVSLLTKYILNFLFFFYREQIMGSIRRNKHALSALLAEYKDKANYDDDYEDNSQRYNKRR